MPSRRPALVAAGALVVASSSFSSPAAALDPWDAELHLIPPSVIAQYGAACLDGSAPGYYVRRPPPGSPNENKWKIHFQGGGWCTSESDCIGRSRSLLGSSTFWGPTLAVDWQPEGAGFYGLMGVTNETNGYNPFGDWSFVWFAYCDGTSFTSNRASPFPINATANLYFRGAANLDAYLQELENTAGFLSNTTELIVSGTSAGGLATYFHTSYLKSRMLQPSARVVGVPDAGFFLDHVSYTQPGVHVWYNTIGGAIGPNLWNATLRGDGAKCLAGEANATNCFFPQYLYPYLSDVDGIFILQSLYDTANLGICYQMSCNLYTSCGAAQVAAIDQYHLDLLHEVQGAVGHFPSRDGAFLTSCYQHEESCRHYDWFDITIRGGTPNSTFYTWYTQGAGAEGSSQVDGPWPSDSSCAPQGFDHGAC